MNIGIKDMSSNHQRRREQRPQPFKLGDKRLGGKRLDQPDEMAIGVIINDRIVGGYRDPPGYLPRAIAMKFARQAREHLFELADAQGNHIDPDRNPCRCQRLNVRKTRRRTCKLHVETPAGPQLHRHENCRSYDHRSHPGCITKIHQEAGAKD